MKYLIRTLLIFFPGSCCCWSFAGTEEKEPQEGKNAENGFSEKKETAWQDRFGETGCQKNGKDDCGQITGAGNCFR